MPFINIKMFGKLSNEQKREIIKEVCDTFERVAKKPRERILIMFDEMEENCVARGDKLILDINKESKSSSKPSSRVKTRQVKK